MIYKELSSTLMNNTLERKAAIVDSIQQKVYLQIKIKSIVRSGLITTTTF